ncbi:ATP-binding protein [Nocardia tengchongensis]|uniref:ATP-binding protein n=1 Tax=Nocardia tengchongensis TaxID=2055889 RepID=UPI003655D258
MLLMLRIHAFGELEVDLDSDPVALPRGHLVRSLLVWLALHPGPHPRARLCGQFWPDAPDGKARASLRSAVWALRIALGSAAELLHTDRDVIELRRDEVWVDALEFDRLRAAGRLEQAVTICRGELLAAHDEDWVRRSRDEYGRRLGVALAGLAAAAESGGELARALDWARRRVTVRPLDEEAGRELIRLSAAAGDRAAALASFDRLRDTLRTELGIDPSPSTLALVDKLCPRTDDAPTAPGSGTPASAAAPSTPPAALASPWAATPLFGRSDELHRLLDCWHQVRAGTGMVVEVTAEGGLGKTRLVEEVVDIAGRDGARTAIGAPGALGGAPYELWSELLAEALEPGERLPGDTLWADDLARLLPGVAAHWAASSPVAAAPQHDQIRLFEAVVEFLGFLAARRPLVVVLEDLHNADPSSLELLRYAGRRLCRIPVLIILTRRPLPPRPSVDGTLAALRARGSLRLELSLQPLSPTAIRHIVRQQARLPKSVEARIVAAVDGNPLLATETARHVAHGAGDPADGLRIATGSALARLSGAGRLFLELMAAAGRDLSRAEIAGLPLLADPAVAATEALGGGLLRVRDTAVGYRHESLRQAVYDDIPPLSRARLHDALAANLAARDTSGRRRAAELARHLRLAGHHHRAAVELRHAAAAAREVAAMAEAAEYLGQAVELDPDPAGPLLELAEVEAWRGLLAESDAAFERALTLIPAADADALLDAWLRRGRWLRGGICHPREARRSYQAALDVLDRVPGADPWIRVEALAGMAWAEAVAGDPEQAAALLREVDPFTRGRTLPDLIAHDIGVARGHALLRSGEFASGYGPLIAAASAARRAGRPDMAYSALASAAGAAACAGDFARALDFVERCLPLVAPTGLTRLAVYAYTGQAAVLRRLGRTGEAADALRLAANAANRLGITAFEGLVHAEAGQLALAGGEFDTAAAEFRAALAAEAPISRPLTRLRLAEALARGGHGAEAESEIEAVALEPVSDSDFPDTLVARMNRVQGLLAAATGDHARAVARLRAAAAGWQRRTSAATIGRRYAANIIDLGRPPLSGLVEPEREYQLVTAELAALTHPAGSPHAHLR